MLSVKLEITYGYAFRKDQSTSLNRLLSETDENMYQTKSEEKSKDRIRQKPKKTKDRIR